MHTGLEIEATFLPAPENHGYKFQRIDLPDQPVVDALAEYVVETERGTVLAKGDVRVSTVEHALAALYAAGVDNCLIKVNAPELPILDGSAIAFSEAIDSVGLVEQSTDKNFYVVKRKIEVRDEKRAHISRCFPIQTSLSTLWCRMILRFSPTSMPVWKMWHRSVATSLPAAHSCLSAKLNRCFMQT